MVKSMTGYGRAVETVNGREFTVEVRSVNNRYLDCTVKLPRAVSFGEDAVKQAVKARISRGKVDVFVTIDTSAADVAVVQVNEGLAKGYFDALTQLKNAFALPGAITPEVLAKFPDVLTVTKAEEDVEAIAADICAVLDDALTEQYLQTGALEDGQITQLIARRRAFACYFGSALKLEGVDELLHGLRDFTRQPERPDASGARPFHRARS